MSPTLAKRDGSRSSTKKLLTAGMASLTLPTLFTIAESPIAAANPVCPVEQIIAIPGTWETGYDQGPRAGMLNAVTDGLPDSISVEYITYPATAFPWEGPIYGASKREAVDNARARVQETASNCAATTFSLIGYSQGADAAGDLAAEISAGAGPIDPSRITAVALVSDPQRSAADTLVGPPVIGEGAGGARVGGFGVLADRVRTFCAPGDLYCALDEQDILGRLAGFAVESSAPTLDTLPDDWARLSQILDDVADGGMRSLTSQFGHRMNHERAVAILKFLRTEVHASYGDYIVDGANTPVTWIRDWFTEAGRPSPAAAVPDPGPRPPTAPTQPAAPVRPAAPVPDVAAPPAPALVPLTVPRQAPAIPIAPPADPAVSLGGRPAARQSPPSADPQAEPPTAPTPTQQDAAATEPADDSDGRVLALLRAALAVLLVVVWLRGETRSRGPAKDQNPR
ncbi:cutinase family protein [Nocardia seriolae]|uniref:cutinase family protein n=1 Tax=Nocardia seriolae TaxID=37332 RepID=UPI00209BDDF0|nr:cutinase family protein [Nocardia seriolae]